jgi:general secretion pathway protein C
LAFDALFKKYFLAVLLGLTLMAAYFQASGTSELLGAALTRAPDASAPPPPVDARPSANGSRRSADPLIGRNPFDSVTGPLDAKGAELPTPVAEQAPVVTDPLAAPACGNVKVQIVTESDDPLWSFAALQGTGDPHPMLRRVGDAVGELEVAYIGYNPTEASPAVWLTGQSNLCQALLFATQPEVQAATPPATGQEAPAVPETVAPCQKRSRTRSRRSATASFTWIAAWWTRSSPTRRS